MKYGIIAAGLGSRLAEEGYDNFKPMVLIKGESILERLISIFSKNDAEGIYIILNEAERQIANDLSQMQFPVPVHFMIKDTPSSLHSFAALISNFPAMDNVCLSTIDSIFRPEEFANYISQFEKDSSLDALMAVSKFEDDESPLYVNLESGSNKKVTSFSSQIESEDYYISGGLYCFRKSALNVAIDAVENGISRMRNFQQELINRSLNVQAFPFTKIIDIDHVTDIEKAESFLIEK